MRPVPLLCKGQMRKHPVDHFKQGILGWILGDRSAKTFQPLWEIVGEWKCYFYVTRTHPRSVPLLRKGQVRSTALEGVPSIYS